MDLSVWVTNLFNYQSAQSLRMGKKGNSPSVEDQWPKVCVLGFLRYAHCNYLHYTYTLDGQSSGNNDYNAVRKLIAIFLNPTPSQQQHTNIQWPTIQWTTLCECEKWYPTMPSCASLRLLFAAVRSFEMPFSRLSSALTTTTTISLHYTQCTVCIYTDE